MRIIRLSDFRSRRQRSASDLDSALERALELRDLRGDFEAELRAADAMASAFDPVSVPAEALVALRAAIAARRAAAARHRARRLAWQTMPGAVAAVTLGLLGYVGLSHHSTSLPPSRINIENADRTLQAITDHISRVQQVVQANDPTAAFSQALATRSILAEAQQQAVGYPADDPARDLLLSALEAKIQQLDALLARLNLPPVQPLPTIKPAGSAQPANRAEAGAAPSSSTTSSTSGSGSTTTSSSSSTTSTTDGGSGVLAAATGAKGSGSSTPSSSTSSSTSSTSSTSTSTSTTTTNPPPPSTTSTTAPPR
ncbi:MAG TPA: hypothetical protein VFH58_14285 [Acidimicrobiales bacterium]|nr:hypothetical protein [Acidimicrobiales bacterium]